VFHVGTLEDIARFDTIYGVKADATFSSGSDFSAGTD
jgi:hypothetical protein